MTAKPRHYGAGAFLMGSIFGTSGCFSCNFYLKAMQSVLHTKQFPLQGLGSTHLSDEGLQQEPVMNSRINSAQIDYKTSRSICDAVGERLQQSLRPEFSRLSPRLQHLLDELRKQDRAGLKRLAN
jgi:hypothetical protein